MLNEMTTMLGIRFLAFAIQHSSFGIQHLTLL